ncbi:MAG: hypothetical protein WDM92_15915 [Caulobacteraceae bacterium]
MRIARETAAASPDSDAAQLNLADNLRDGEHYEESAKVLDGLIAKAGDHADWHLYYGAAWRWSGRATGPRRSATSTRPWR